MSNFPGTKGTLLHVLQKYKILTDIGQTPTMHVMYT